MHYHLTITHKDDPHRTDYAIADWLDVWAWFKHIENTGSKLTMKECCKDCPLSEEE